MSNLKQLAGMKAMRYCMTGIVFPDVYTGSHVATQISRMNAYTDGLADQGFPNMKMLKQAELENYKNYFDLSIVCSFPNGACSTGAAESYWVQYGSST